MKQSESQEGFCQTYQKLKFQFKMTNLDTKIQSRQVKTRIITIINTRILDNNPQKFMQVTTQKSRSKEQRND